MVVGIQASGSGGIGAPVGGGSTPRKHHVTTQCSRTVETPAGLAGGEGRARGFEMSHLWFPISRLHHIPRVLVAANPQTPCFSITNFQPSSRNDSRTHLQSTEYIVGFVRGQPAWRAAISNPAPSPPLWAWKYKYLGLSMLHASRRRLGGWGKQRTEHGRAHAPGPSQQAACWCV